MNNRTTQTTNFIIKNDGVKNVDKIMEELECHYIRLSNVQIEFKSNIYDTATVIIDEGAFTVQTVWLCNDYYLNAINIYNILSMHMEKNNILKSYNNLIDLLNCE